MDVQLVGKVGVTLVTLVGGPHDGESRAAVVGAPVLVRIKPPKAKKPQAASGLFFMSYTTSEEGEEWKVEGHAKADARKRYALYLPEMAKGKATGAARFAGECEMVAP